MTVAALLAVPLLVGAGALPTSVGAGAPASGHSLVDPLGGLGPALFGTETGPGTSGVAGEVWGEPPCRKSSPPCMVPARTVEAQVRLVREGSGSVVRETHSGKDGKFRISAPPGRYIIQAAPDDGGTCDPVPVEVQPRRYTEVGVGCTI